MNFSRNIADFRLLYPQKYPVKPLKKTEPKEVKGLDIETYQGYAYLICDSEGGYLWIKDIDSALEYLTQRRFRQKHNFFYNLRFDYQAILKLVTGKYVI